MLLRKLSSCVKMGHHQANKSKAVPGNSRIFGYKWTISAYFSITECTFEDMCKVFGIPELRRKAHFCAVSSTSGTATEVTAFSIITDYQKGIKYPIADFEITPDVAIVDPELAETMPRKLVAHTGIGFFQELLLQGLQPRINLRHPGTVAGQHGPLHRQLHPWQELILLGDQLVEGSHDRRVHILLVNGP